MLTELRRPGKDVSMKTLETLASQVENKPNGRYYFLCVKAWIKSIGNGKITVLAFSSDISVSV